MKTLRDFNKISWTIYLISTSLNYQDFVGKTEITDNLWIFYLKMFSYSNIFCTFALWFWKESPVKVHLAVLNWELGCESPTVPQQWTPLWLLSINAIKLSLIAFTLYKARIHSALFSLNHAIAPFGWEGAWEWRKVWRPAFFGKCQTTLDVRARGEQTFSWDKLNRRKDCLVDSFVDSAQLCAHTCIIM